MDRVNALWYGYDRDLMQYETEYTPAFPWNHEGRQDVPRYVKGEDGYWYDPSAKENKNALISCTGDIMCEPMQHRAYKYGDSYFFHPEFRFVRSIFKNSDFVVGNLETNVTDCTPYAGEHHVIGSKYHCNAPECYLESLRYAGFDALVNANNHDLDSCLTGLTDTLHALDRHQFMHTGTFLPSDAERVLLVKVNGIRIAIASYSTKYNKLEANLTQQGRDVFLNAYSKDKAAQDVIWAREHDAQYFISYIHWGKEHTHEPIEDQLRWAQELADAGVDYIVGSHSHCLQRYRKIRACDGREVPCIYSLGNFVTGARDEICKHSAILQLLLTEEAGKILCKEYFIPGYVFTKIDTASYAHVPLDGMLSGGIENDTLRSAKDYIDNVVQGLEHLPTGCVTLKQLCDAMGVAAPAENARKPVTRITAQLETVISGAVLFWEGGFTPRQKLYLQRDGVLAIITDTPVEGLPTIVTDRVSAAYEKAVGFLRSKFPGEVILVTGHGGKTETKERICAVLQTRYPVLTHADGPVIDTAVWQNFHPRHPYCVQELRPDHPYYGEYLRAVKPLICVDTDRAAPGSTFPEDDRAAALARQVGKKLGVPNENIISALRDYRSSNPARRIETAGGITLVMDTACKDMQSAVGALYAFHAQPGRHIAAIGQMDCDTDYAAIGRFLKADFAVFCGENAEVLADSFPGECVCVQTERELEKTLLEKLQEGDALLLCSGRSLPFSTTARKLFGITDGSIPNLW